MKSIGKSPVGHPVVQGWVCQLFIALLLGLCGPGLLAAPPPLTLANIYRAGVPLEHYWASEKFDGVRAYWDGARLVTRQGNPVPAPAWFTEGFPRQPLDGELWMGRGSFEAVSAAVRRHLADDAEWRRIRYLVFDLPASSAPFDERIVLLDALLLAAPSPYLGRVVHARVATHAELMAMLDEVVATGGEGLMLRRGQSLSAAGRSDDLLKVKRYEDAEATVVGYTPGRGKYTGMVGALVVETGDGVRFRLGSGLTDELRREPPALGATVTFRHYGLTRRGLPRFASFMRIRPDGV